MSLYIPKKYRATLMPEMMEQAIKQIKDSFQTMLAEELDLRRVTAPLLSINGIGNGQSAQKTAISNSSRGSFAEFTV